MRQVLVFSNAETSFFETIYLTYAMSTQRSGETSCFGQIDGKQCRTFLRKDTKFCSNCGTRNPAKIATDGT